MRVSLEEISIWISRLNKEDLPSQHSRYHPIRQRPVSNKNRERVEFLALGWDIHLLPLHTGASGSQAFTLGLKHTTGSPGSLACRQKTVGLLSLMTTWANSCKKSPCIPMYTCYWFCFSGEPQLIRLHSRPIKWETCSLCFNKSSKWWQYMLNCENNFSTAYIPVSKR